MPFCCLYTLFSFSIFADLYEKRKKSNGNEFTCTFTRAVKSSSGGVCVCVFFLCGCERGGGVEWSGCISIQQWLPMRSAWEVGWREGGMVVVGGATHLQSRTVQWAGTKQLDRGFLDWRSPARAPRPAKTHCTGPDKRISCSVCVPESNKTSTGTSRHPHEIPFGHEKAMKTSLTLFFQEGDVFEYRRPL